MSIRVASIIAVLAFAASCAPASPANPGVADPLTPSDGLVTVPSSHGVDETFNRLRGAIEEKEPLSVIATVDHAANARGAGMELPPTRLLIFGNPNLGTPLMRSSRTVGIDLPQKFLVWEDEQGQVFITYNDPAYLARRHDLRNQDEVLEQISAALRGLAEAAASP